MQNRLEMDRLLLSMYALNKPQNFNGLRNSSSRDGSNQSMCEFRVYEVTALGSTQPKWCLGRTCLFKKEKLLAVLC